MFETIFMALLPFLQQGLKLLTEKFGLVLNKWQNQLLSLVLTVVFLLFTGGFPVLTLPIWSGDLMAYISTWVTLVGLTWGAVALSYEVIWDKLFTFASNKLSGLRLVTKDKLV